MQDFQESGWVCEKWCHRSFFRLNILRMASDWNCLAKHRYCQRSWSKKELTCQIIFVMDFVILHCVFGSHLIFEWNMYVLCLLVVLKSRDASFKGYFWQNILIKLQHAIKINQSWRLKVFWLQKWLDAWKYHEVTKQFWTHTSWNWTTLHTVKF
jgi:hypothetical protein